jgi:TPR repeat protein
MNRDQIENLLRQENAAYKEGKFDLALQLAEKLSNENVPSSFFTCGLILEKGWSSCGIDLDRALEFYRKLAVRWNDAEGYLGCVRIILAKNDFDQRDKAIQYCLTESMGRLSYLAYLLLARIYEEMYMPPDYNLAKKYCIKSIFHGSAWALRKYALLLGRSGNVVGAFSMHIVATVCSPLIVVFGGFKKVRKG